MKTLCAGVLLATLSVALAMSLRGEQEKADEAKLNLFSGMKRNAKGQRTGVDNVIDICYFCDSNCEAVVNGGAHDHSVMNAYFQGITDQLSANLARLDPALSANFYYAAYPEASLELAWYGSDMAAVNTAFWGDGGLYEAAGNMGCDAGFLVVSPSDALLASQSTTGVANMFGICGELSYGIVAEAGNVAPLLSHEVGHLLGMYHSDEAMDPSTFASVQTMYPAEYQALVDNCPDEGCGTMCIMNPSINAAATDYGECGRAYYNMMRTISADYPYVYPASNCIDGHVNRFAPEQKQGDGVPPEINQLMDLFGRQDAPVFPTIGPSQ